MTMPEDWLIWPTFSSTVICLSRASARRWALRRRPGGGLGGEADGHCQRSATGSEDMAFVLKHSDVESLHGYRSHWGVWMV